MKRKTISVLIILGIILFLFGFFSGHDWTLFFLRIADLSNPEIYSRFMKFPVTFLCALLTWIIARDGVDVRDTRRLQLAYSLIVLGDIIFFFNVHSVIGVFAFAAAHLVLVRRNAAGLAGYPKKGGLWILLAAILGVCLALMFIVFYPMLKGDVPYFLTLTGYALIIGASLWAALAALKIGFFPAPGARIIAIGVLCFFLSDVCVGFYRSLPPGQTRVFATYITWIFYTPALALVALSGYDLKRLFSS
jgi:hypothetical protein